MFTIHRTFTLSNGVKGGTIAVYNDGKSRIGVLYHQTVVVEKCGKTITIRNGGWDTPSTRAVINRAMEQLTNDPFYLYRKDGISIVSHHGKTKTFISGMKIKVIE